jgi:hypothetical protein
MSTACLNFVRIDSRFRTGLKPVPVKISGWNPDRAGGRQPHRAAIRHRVDVCLGVDDGEATCSWQKRMAGVMRKD